MNHTECKDCKLREGDCGYHHRFDGVVNLDIPSLSSCDRYGNCGHFQQKETPKGDLISREALKKAFKIEELYWGKRIIGEIDNAPTVKACFTTKDLEDAYIRGKESGKKEQKATLAKEAREIADENYKYGYEKGKAENERPQGECETCTYRIFTEKFTDSISEVMTQYGITSIEELQARLQEEMRGGDNEHL